MGNCRSNPTSAETKRSRGIDLRIERDAEDDAKKVKLLLLGAGDSGKSTLFKQFRILYGKGFTEAERLSYRPIIQANILGSMKTLIRQAEAMKFLVMATAEKYAVAHAPEGAPVTPALAAAVAALWADEGILKTFGERALFQLNDSAPYFFARAAAVSDAKFVPTVEDVLRCRLRTTGISEEDYWIEHVPFCIADVGGQRNERKKWINSFEGVTAVIFVASLSEYDQALEEDATVNRLVESMELFAEVANSKWFEHASIILFLNKRDLFSAKIAVTDLRHEGGGGLPPRFLDYTGGCNAEAAQQYLIDRFLELSRRDRPILHHVTTATDSHNIKVVFKACKESIMRDNLRRAGLE